ncbi:hypothetical protein ACMDCR_25755 [Labrys okinawensis]|uniref:hypothetical protein n=1 Tax=Labrys okinawensis TaxID=346911 RepID=UPI0039BCDA12
MVAKSARSIAAALAESLFALEQAALARLNLGGLARIRAAQRDVRVVRRQLCSLINRSFR